MTEPFNAPTGQPTPPEVELGTAMRRVRETHKISLREMAKRLGYRSHTTLGDYELGRKMASEEAVDGYERVLHLAPGTLRAVLEQARTESHGDVFAKRRPRLTPLTGLRHRRPPFSRRVIFACVAAL